MPNKITGTGANDTLGGSMQDDIIDGGKGADMMAGHGGNDTYYIDNAGDQVIELAGEGADTVISSIAFNNTIANVEYYQFNTATAVTFTANTNTLSVTGGSGADSLTASSAGTQLDGGAGNDTLIGGSQEDTLIGGLGADIMTGKGGNDTYYVDNIGDQVIEAANGGNDWIYAGISVAKLADNVENVVLTGAANLTATGNDTNNYLYGNGGNNVLDGGKGADTMYGGNGNDTYYVDDANDYVGEFTGNAGGIDTVISSVSYDVSGVSVENVTLTGTAANAMGNDLNNILTGNDAGNSLNGGLGKDTMIGGKGDDTYYVDDIGDKVVESIGGAAGGHDAVASTISFSLAGLANVEDLYLINSGLLNATGNALDNLLAGNNDFNILDGGLGKDAMFGAGGNDTYMVDNLGDQVFENANNGIDLVISTVALTQAYAEVEDYVFNTKTALNFTTDGLDNDIIGGSGNDTINAGGGTNHVTGGAGNDTLTTGSGGDTLDGGTGADTMTGGDGIDTYIVDNVGDKVIELQNGGTDRVFSTVSLIELFTNVESATLTGATNLNLTGNTLDNTLNGNSGANILDGGSGKDTMSGFAGNDTYIVDNAGDVVNEYNAGFSGDAGGIDTVKSSVSYVLSKYVENLTLVNGAGNLEADGNELNNILTGNDGSNTLRGYAGNDTLIGGAGDDFYFIEDAGDKVQETIAGAAGGHDTILSAVTYSLAASPNVEDLTSDGGASINLTGNALDNTITGNSGNNIIDGGKGTDKMAGGISNDTYYVDNVGDQVIELSNQGHDVVISSIALSGAFSQVEDYFFKTAVAVHFSGNGLDNNIGGGSGNDEIDGGGTGTDNLYGYAGNDKLTGGSGTDFIDGGVGADVMAGFGNGDYYIVDNVKDQVIELSNNGHDTVTSTVSIAQLFDNVEDLYLTGAGNLSATGNGLDNYISGTSGANALNGGGGNDTLWAYAGNDTLTGGTGIDVFGFDLFSNNGKDLITDFVKASDQLSFTTNDTNNDGKSDLTDLINHISSIIDGGAGKNVTVAFDTGGSITFAGCGTGMVTQLADLVSNNSQIHVSNGA